MISGGCRGSLRKKFRGVSKQFCEFSPRFFPGVPRQGIQNQDFQDDFQDFQDFHKEKTSFSEEKTRL